MLRQRYYDADGNPLAGGKLYTYAAGTTTPQATYTDQGGGTPNENPIVLDANGEAAMWLDPSLSYKFVLKNSSDTTQWTVDNVVGLLTADAVNTAAIADDAVTMAKIADDAVGADQLRDDASTDGNRAVTTNHIRDGAVTVPKVATTLVTSPVNLGIAASVGSNALTVALKTAGGSDASSSDPVKIPFRSSTATTGTPVVRSVTGALSVVVPSSATLGSTNGDPNWVYVYAIDNAGTVELAVSGQKIADEGSLVSTTAISASATSAVTLYSTSARSNVGIRLLGRVKSTQATAGTWATSPSEISLVPFEGQAPRSMVRVHSGVSGAGHGSTNTKIRRFNTAVANYGSAITFADSVGDGASFTINEDGVYAISYTDYHAGGDCEIGISLSSSELTTNIGSITAADRLTYTAIESGTGPACCGATVVLRAGDVIRAHTDGTPTSTSAQHTLFTITQVRR